MPTISELNRGFRVAVAKVKSGLRINFADQGDQSLYFPFRF